MDIDQLLLDLSLAEKASLTLGGDMWHTQAIERVGIPAIMVSDGPHGMRTQKAEGDMAGIGGSEPATCFPTACLIASSWDTELIVEVGRAIGAEARSLNVAVVLGPGVNIKRSPLCGRNFEYLSEDPFLTGELGLAMVEGIQSTGVGSSLKHFAANNQETDRLRVSADIDLRTLREIYLPAFERIVTAGQPWTVMCAYNALNGELCSQNEWLLTEVLAGEWGFQGLVVSDWGAVKDQVCSVGAGLSLEMPPKTGLSDTALVVAIENDTMSLEPLDLAARRVLELVERGAFVNDLAESVDFDAHHALARRAAAESIVLLKNEERLLPLRVGAKVAVIGEFARTPRYQGGGSSQVNATRTESALEAFRAWGEVAYGAGFTLAGVEGTASDDELRAEAVALATATDVAVLFLGLADAEESEGFDRTHIDLPANQLTLLDEVSAANPNVAVVLSNGSVVQLTGWDHQARAIVECWLGGQAVGSAVVDVLTGQANPSGKLAETIPHKLSDSPSHGHFPGDSGTVRYGEGLGVGYRGFDLAEREVAYPFGFGLSYTSFSYDRIEVSVTGSPAANDLAAVVKVAITNTGDVTGKEIVQVYVRDPECSVKRPVRELKGFDKIELQPGASGSVEIALDQRAFSFWSESLERFVVEAGEFLIDAGPHSRDLPLNESVRVEAPSVASPLNEDSSLQEWLADPVGSQVLVEAHGEEGKLTGMFADEHLITVIGNFPLERLMSFPGSPIPRTELPALLAAVQRREG